MLKLNVICLILLAILAPSKCLKSEEIIEKLRKGAWDIYEKANTQEGYKNFVVSPISLQHVLGMIALGSTRKSRTQKQILNGLGFSDENDSTYLDSIYDNNFENIIFHHLGGTMDIVKDDRYSKLVNRIYLNGNFYIHNEYSTLLDSYFATSIVPFSSTLSRTASAINKFVSGETNRMIENIISRSDLYSSTPLVLVNVAYFRGDWDFEPMNDPLQWRDFTNTGYTGNFKTCNARGIQSLSTQTFYYLDKESSEGLLYVAVPYKTNNAYFVVVKPLIDYEDAIKHWEISSYRSRLLERYLPALPDKNGQVTSTRETWTKSNSNERLQMPEFEIGSDLNDPVEMFIRMGIVDMFQPDYADLKKMIKARRNTPNLYITNLMHKAKINVNHEGTTAAAATAAITGVRSLQVPSDDLSMIKVDQTCFFGIYKDGYFLFQGNLHIPNTCT